MGRNVVLDCVWDKSNWSTPLWYAVRETTLVGLTNLISRNPPIPPKLDKKQALFVLTKIDEILAWEQRSQTERDTRFVELGRYLCEVREADILGASEREGLVSRVGPRKSRVKLPLGV